MNHKRVAMPMRFLGINMTMRLRIAFFKAFLRQDVEFYDTPGISSGVLTSRLGKDGAEGIGSLRPETGRVSDSVDSFTT